MSRVDTALAAALACLTTFGCQWEPVPATDLLVDDPALAAEMRLAVEDWAAAGLEVASEVTINEDPNGVPVVLVPREKINRECGLSRTARATLDAAGKTLLGCARRDADGAPTALWIGDDLDSATRMAVLRHELIHVILPGVPHVPEDSAGVFAPYDPSPFITMGDLMHLAQYTTVHLD